MEGLVLAPDTDPVEKIRHLEEEISTFIIQSPSVSAYPVSPAQLKSRIFDQQTHLSPSPSRNLGAGHTRDPSSTSGVDRQSPNAIGSPNASGIALPHASLDIMNINLNSGSPDSRYRSESSSPQINAKGSDPFMDLLFSGWNPDLPDPILLHH